jgi:hypothetical protein
MVNDTFLKSQVKLTIILIQKYPECSELQTTCIEVPKKCRRNMYGPIAMICIAKAPVTAGFRGLAKLWDFSGTDW